MTKALFKYSGLRSAARALQRKGKGDDSILAHISPEEARFMHSHFGSDINPDTGLTQFGFFRRIEKSLRKPFKMAAPVIGSLVGGIFGGPAGAIAGGSLGGALTSRNHMLDHALGGATVGLGHSILSPMIGSSLGLAPESMMGKAMMTGAPSLLQQVGSLGGASRFLGSGKQQTYQVPSESEISSTGSSGGIDGLGLLNTGLLGATLAGTLLAKQKYPAFGTPGNESMQQAVARNKFEWGPEHAHNVPPPRDFSKMKFPPKSYRKTKWNFFPTPEEQETQLREATEEMREPGYERRYKKGGHVKGYYEGSEGGQSDKRPVKLKPNSYIMDATTVSLSGDGNSKNGAKKIRKWIDSFGKSGIIRNPQTSHNIKAMVSDSEMEIKPKEVAAAGGGSIKEGIKVLDSFRKNLRKHKGVKKFLPPKSKPLNQYVR